MASRIPFISEQGVRELRRYMDGLDSALTAQQVKDRSELWWTSYGTWEVTTAVAKAAGKVGWTFGNSKRHGGFVFSDDEETTKHILETSHRDVHSRGVTYRIQAEGAENQRHVTHDERVLIQDYTWAITGLLNELADKLGWMPRIDPNNE